ncbi:NAD(P)/FAD-dependent oxidoreductase [Parafilimonas sp.]|uniref:NAD(P)/FAD-dependent oxidoreductase n=1 Tax=Parafilimonas sp. TaxID=1969739 RepID=UPI0039E501D0
MQHPFDVIIIGGGAAGFFTAINLSEKNASLKIAILERGKEVLSKVRISGGGRCNVTHACFDANELTGYYPRGNKELRGPFHTFAAADTVTWFQQHGVLIKKEEDGRIFPQANTSQAVIDCFTRLQQSSGIQLFTGENVLSLQRSNDIWQLQTQQTMFIAKQICIATGNSPAVWKLLQQLGHTIIPPVPSLFTFNCKDERIIHLPGVATNAAVSIKDTKLKASGPVLITHWGMSGPAVLKLSAWGARMLHEKNYSFILFVNWLPEEDVESALQKLKLLKEQQAQKIIAVKSPFVIPSRLWESIVHASAISKQTRWADVSNIQLQQLAQQLCNAQFTIHGKSSFKEEFVTAGGIDLKEIDFKTMRSKVLPNVYFAGEVLNIDAVTGGFNFQNAWTGGYIAASAIGAGE